MSDDTTNKTAIAQLERALASAKLPAKAHQTGEKLLKRLTTPVRMVILGLPKCGKSKIFNILAGQAILPDGLTHSTFELAFGTAPYVDCTLDSGDVETFDAFDINQIVALSPALVSVKLPIPALENISVLEVVADESRDDLIAAVDWAVRRADIVIWCSTDLSPLEQEIWSRIPDSIKDHSFFVLTKADLLAKQGVLADQIARTQEIVASEFQGFFSIATRQAAAALGPNGITSTSEFNASGANALLKKINGQIETGLQNDRDNVLLFLNRFRDVLEPAIPTSEQTVAQAAQETEPANVEPEKADLAKAEPAPKMIDSQVSELFTQAIGHIQNRAAELSDVVCENESDFADAVLERCLTTANEISDIFLESTSNAPEIGDVQENVLETADLLVLMELESAIGAAADAVTLLLQLRKDMEMRLAA